MNVEKQAKKFMKGAKANWNKAKRTYICRSLKDLIRAYRACTTAEEEKALVKIEAAQIRDLFREGDKHYRRQNIAKLLFFHMNGYPTDFGITECVKLCASNKFSDKRVAYLGITILVDESDQVLMLVTNSIKQDLVSHDVQIVSLALNVLGDIASAEMVRELMPEIEKLMLSSNPAVRKKAGLAAVRAIRKLTAEETANILTLLPQYFDFKSPAVHVSGAAVVMALCNQDDANIPELHQSVLPILLRLILSTTTESSVNTKGTKSSGKAKSFLQVRLLSAVRMLIEVSIPSPEVMQNVNDALSTIASKDDFAKIEGCSVLYECARVAALIESSEEFRTLAVRILGKFLSHKEATVRYIALQELTGLVEIHGAGILAKIEDHKDKILAGLHEVDPTVRSQAVELVCRIANAQNVEELVNELVEYIRTAKSPTSVKDGCEKVFFLADRFGTSEKWKIETFLTTLKLGDIALSENLVLHLISVISANPSIQPHAVRLLYDAIKEKSDSEGETTVSRKPLSESVALYVIGEHSGATSTAGVNARQVVEAFEELLTSSEEVEEEWLNTGKASFNTGNEALGRIALSALTKFACQMTKGNEDPSGIDALVSDAIGIESKPPPLLTSGKETASDIEAMLFGEPDKKPGTSTALVPANQEVGTLALIDDDIFGGGNASAAATTQDQSVVINQVTHLLSRAARSSDVEKQQRACEYMAMMENRPALAAAMAPISGAPIHQLKVASKPTRSKLRTKAQSTGNTALLLDLMDDADVESGNGADVPAIMGAGNAPLALPSTDSTAGGSGLETLDDILSLGSGAVVPQPTMPQGDGPSLLTNLDALAVLDTNNTQIDDVAAQPSNNATDEQAGSCNPDIETVILESNDVVVNATFFKDQQDSSKSRADLVIRNKSTFPMTDAILQLAVPRYMHLNMLPASSSEIDSGAEATQTVSLENTLQGDKPVQLRYRMEFKLGGQEPVRLEGVVSHLDSL